MKHALLVLRSVILWVLSILHFFIAAPILVLLGVFLDPRKHDWLGDWREVNTSVGADARQYGAWNGAERNQSRRNHDPTRPFCAVIHGGATRASSDWIDRSFGIGIVE